MNQREEIDPVEEICGVLREMTRRTEAVLTRIRERRNRMKEENDDLRDELDGDLPLPDKLALAERVIEEGLRREENFRNGVENLEKALQFIADQPCQKHAEGASDDTDCTETGACVTEFCLPCYAKTFLKFHRTGEVTAPWNDEGSSEKSWNDYLEGLYGNNAEDPYTFGAAKMLNIEPGSVTKELRSMFKETFFSCLRQRLRDEEFAKQLAKDVAFHCRVEEGSSTCHHPRSVTCEHCNREICPDCGKGYCKGGC